MDILEIASINRKRGRRRPVWNFPFKKLLCILSPVYCSLSGVAVLPSHLSGVGRSTGVLWPRHGWADQLDQVTHQAFLSLQGLWLWWFMKHFYDGIQRCCSVFSRSQAPVAAVFAASPQLLGTIKLCSSSVVTSLPLYTDINFLKRAEDVSKIRFI